MARRENQSLVIALIVMVMLVVTLCISTYVFWNKAQKSEKDLANTKTSAQTAQNSARTSVDEAIRMKAMLGYESDIDIATMETNFEADKKLFANGIAANDQNYRKLPEHLVAAIQERNKQLLELNSTKVTLTAAQATIRSEEQGRVVVAQTGETSAANDLTAEQKKFQDALRKNSDTVAKVQRSKDKAIKDIGAEKQEALRQVALLTSDYDILSAKNAQLEEKLRKLQNVSFERPDGKITYVNQRSESVYINLGSADGLQRQATFSVYDSQENDMSRLEPKGKIEVIKVLGDHLSEGRILEDTAADPILTEDAIYSPVWEAGRPIHFALAGLLDTNGDGKSDANMVKNLISRNGGVIDAEVSDRGIRTGDVSIETRYIVIGKRPIDKADTGGQKAYSRIRNEAESFGISEISLERFLTDMGYQAVGKMVKLGKGATMPDPTKGQPRRGTGRFRPRQPPKTKSSN